MEKVELILNELLLEIAKEQNFKNYDVKIEPINSGGANYTSILNNVTITEGDRVVHMFAKVAAAGEEIRSQVPQIFQTESFFYTNLLKVFQRFENEHQIPQEHRLACPKFYGCNAKFSQETIVMENLVKAGYQAYDRFKSVNWEYSKSAVTQLAKFHALSLAYGEYYPEEYNKLFSRFKVIFDVNNKVMSEYMQSTISKGLQVVREENRGKLRRFVDTYVDDKERYTSLYKSKRQVLGHGDYRPSNLMHKIREVSEFKIPNIPLA